MDRWLATTDAPLVAYFHAWELDPAQPRIVGAPRLQRLRHYRNLDRMRARLSNPAEIVAVRGDFPKTDDLDICKTCVYRALCDRL